MKEYKPHNRILAAIFSILLPGAGHFYVGYAIRGLLLLVALLTLQYLFMYLFTLYVNPILVVVASIILIAIYIYGIYNPIQIINNCQDKYRKYNHWSITLIIFMPIMYLFGKTIINYIPLKPFYMPAKSMENTILKGDFLVAQKSKELSRGELSVFLYPNKSIYYLKRCVAIGGDEIIYLNKKLLIHFHEGDAYIKTHYPAFKIRQLRSKLWVINPYMDTYPGIQYTPDGEPIFDILLKYYTYKQKIGVVPIYIKELDVPIYKIGSETINALYAKVEKDHYYMIGDNRENSNDSRFIGSVHKSLLYGKPSTIYFHLSEDMSIDWGRVGIQFNKAILKDSI